VRLGHDGRREGSLKAPEEQEAEPTVEKPAEKKEEEKK
jgi:hypothetical protein